jgi:hypothetical protein
MSTRIFGLREAKMERKRNPQPWVTVRVRRDVRQKLAEIAGTVDHSPEHMTDCLLRFALEKYEDAGDYQAFMERWPGIHAGVTLETFPKRTASGREWLGKG